MSKSINILHISPNFNYTCGVSKYLSLILPELKKRTDINLFFITNGGDSLERLETKGIQPIRIKFNTGLKNLFYLKNNLKELKNFCLENKIDIIHTHHRYPEFLANQLKKKLKIKTITTVHSLVKGQKTFSFKSDKIIAVSKAVEKNLIEYFNINPEKIIQLYNPLNPDLINTQNVSHPYQNELNILSKYRVILFIGRNHKYKGLDLLVKAFNIISNEYNDIALVIISDLSDTQKRTIQANNKRIFIFKPHNEVRHFYEIAEIVVLPSIMESFPYVMLEAGLYGTLFLGSNVGGIDEFIQDEVNGFKFRCCDFDNLYNKINYILNLSDETKERIKKNLLNKVLNLDTPETYTEKLISIYSQLLKSG